MSSLVEQSGTRVARPLSVLVSLIKQDLKDASAAAERAAQPYHQAVADKLCEARTQMNYSEFLSWTNRHFSIKETQTKRYLTIGNFKEIKDRARDDAPVSMSERLREIGVEPRGAARGGASIVDAVKPVLNRINFDVMRQDELKRSEERDLQRKLAIQLIDIGFKVLAEKLHPDKGGSRDAMSRLNQVRERLKQHA